MNEKLKELAEQARKYAWENETHWSANAEREALFEQKFAELIVRECSLFVFKQNGPKSALNLLEHFGVEE